jgi:hypothetical protein
VKTNDFWRDRNYRKLFEPLVFNPGTDRRRIVRRVGELVDSALAHAAADQEVTFDLPEYQRFEGDIECAVDYFYGKNP